MDRRTFIGNTALGVSSFFCSRDLFATGEDDQVYGHNGMRYQQVANWGKLDATRYPVNDCHEMVQDAQGRIFLLTNETKNNVLIYGTDGKLLDTWGHQFIGGHGLTIVGEGSDQFLLITDTGLHQVFKTTLDGRVIMTLDYPEETGLYASKEEYIPTETTVGPDGDIYVADGYGKQYILRYSADGKLKGWFGGRGDGEQFFDNAHGICIETRTDSPCLLITDRTRCCFKHFTFDGRLIDVLHLPGACVCRPVIKGDHLYAAVLRSPDMDQPNTGFVTIINKENKVVSNIGGQEPVYQNGGLGLMRQSVPLFAHPHDVCIDQDENIYVAQWASGKVYPYKFKRV